MATAFCRLTHLICLAAVVLSVAPARAAQPGTTESVDFGDFRLSVYAQDQATFLVALTYRGRTVYQGESYIADPIKTLAVHEDFPAKDCRTMIATMYSGGAHCCSFAVIVTLGPDGPSAQVAALAEDGLAMLDADHDGVMELELVDWSFAYYHLDSDHSLCFACSPGFSRYLVYDRGAWRPDRPGEFTERYRELQFEPSGSDPALAMQAAYCELMAGGAVADVSGTLLDLLPMDWRDVLDSVLADLINAAQDYAPVTPIGLN